MKPLLTFLLAIFSSGYFFAQCEPDSGFWKPSLEKEKVWSLRHVYKLTEADYKKEIDVFVLDGYDTSKGKVDSIKAYFRNQYQKEIKLVAYFSGGSAENWRSDYNNMESFGLLGDTLKSWKNEKWLDVRKPKLLLPFMEIRVNLAKAKGFDGIEFDNIDGWEEDENDDDYFTGFKISKEQQRLYNL